MSVLVRFAPSPTGRLHAGNLRTAIINWLYARQENGQFMLRIDDTDTSRSTAEYAKAIEDDLAWLGLTHDLTAHQSARFERYDAVAQELKDKNLLYPCYETPEELARKRKRLLARGKPPVYDRAALALDEAQKQELEAEGRRPHWRFKLSGQLREFNDLIRGHTHFETASLSDPVLIRHDGGYLYTLPSVVDDIDFNVSHIIRGEDHVSNSAVQIEVFEALGSAPPQFAHHSLLVGADGGGLSKRAGSLALHELREQGVEPLALVSYIAKIGTSDPIDAHRAMDSLIEEFSFQKFGRAPAHFEMRELHHLTKKVLHETAFRDVAGRLKELRVAGGDDFWQAVRGNIAVLGDVKKWWQVVAGEMSPVIEDKNFCTIAAGLLPQEPYDEDSWGVWTNAVKQATGRKGRDLFHPLRLALTGREQGPELKLLLPLIGRARALTRLQGSSPKA